MAETIATECCGNKNSSSQLEEEEAETIGAALEWWEVGANAGL